MMNIGFIKALLVACAVVVLVPSNVQGFTIGCTHWGINALYVPNYECAIVRDELNKVDGISGFSCDYSLDQAWLTTGIDWRANASKCNAAADVLNMFPNMSGFGCDESPVSIYDRSKGPGNLLVRNNCSAVVGELKEWIEAGATSMNQYLACNPVGDYQPDGTCKCTDPTAVGPACKFSNATTCSGAGVVDYDGRCTCDDPTVGGGPTCSECSNAKTCNGAGTVDASCKCTCDGPETGLGLSCSENSNAKTCNGAGTVTLPVPPAPKFGRYLRIGSLIGEELNLEEIEAFGPSYMAVDAPLMFLNPANASMYPRFLTSGGIERSAEKCIDGSKKGTMCHAWHLKRDMIYDGDTSRYANPDWIRVDYGKPVNILKIVVTNRLDCESCKDWIAGATVTITDDEDGENVVWGGSFEGTQDVYTFAVKPAIPAPGKCTCDAGFSGKECQYSRHEYCSPGCTNAWLSDGMCDSLCDVPACDYDGGDCKVGGTTMCSSSAHGHRMSRGEKGSGHFRGQLVQLLASTAPAPSAIANSKSRRDNWREANTEAEIYACKRFGLNGSGCSNIRFGCVCPKVYTQGAYDDDYDIWDAFDNIAGPIVDIFDGDDDDDDDRQQSQQSPDDDDDCWLCFWSSNDDADDWWGFGENWPDDPVFNDDDAFGTFLWGVGTTIAGTVCPVCGVIITSAEFANDAAACSSALCLGSTALSSVVDHFTPDAVVLVDGIWELGENSVTPSEYVSDASTTAACNELYGYTNNRCRDRRFFNIASHDGRLEFFSQDDWLDSSIHEVSITIDNNDRRRSSSPRVVKEMLGCSESLHSTRMVATEFAGDLYCDCLHHREHSNLVESRHFENFTQMAIFCLAESGAEFAIIEQAKQSDDVVAFVKHLHNGKFEARCALGVRAPAPGPDNTGDNTAVRAPAAGPDNTGDNTARSGTLVLASLSLYSGMLSAIVFFTFSC